MTNLFSGLLVVLLLRFYCIFIVLSDKVTKASLESIQRSIVVLCLDAANPVSSDMRSVAGHQMLHGSGPGSHSGNRWFDKTIQVLTTRQV